MDQYFIQELINNTEAYRQTYRLLIISGVLHTLPFFIVLIIMCDGISMYTKKWQKVLSFIVYFVIDFITCAVSYVLSHRFIKGDMDIDNTIEIFARGWYSYQDYAYIGGSLIVSLAIGVGVALLVRYRPKKLYGSRRRIGKIGLAITALSISGTLLISILLLNEGFSGINHLMINEVCGNNYSVPINGDMDVADYVEIYNNGAHACLTDGIYISDDQDNLKKLAVEEFLIPNYGKAVVSFKDQSFGISKLGGEVVFLSDSFGNIIDSVEIPATKENQSFSRISNGSSEWVITGCTPGENNDLAIDALDNPIFSADAGFYDESFELELYSPDNASIYYTLDGSEPTKDSMLYDGKIQIYDRSTEDNIYRSLPNVVSGWAVKTGLTDEEYVPDMTPVDKAFVVRAIAIVDDNHMSDIVTHTYFVNLDKYAEHNVISIVGDPDRIFGDDGIYVTGREFDEWHQNGEEGEEIYPNFSRRGRNYEVPVSFEYFGKSVQIAQKAGLRIQGNSSDEFPLKPFSVYSRKEYSGNRYFPRQIFGTDYTHSFSIRGGISNTIIPNVVRDRDVASLQTSTACIFINGEYWYSGALTEKFREDYFREHYGIEKDNLIIIQDGALISGNEDETFISDEIAEYIDSLDFAKNEDYKDFCSKFDVQSYIDLMCIDAYITNTDHGDIYQNDILWKARAATDDGYADGRWRWALFDLDAADDFASENRVTINGAQWLMNHELFQKLIQNESFKKQFLDSFLEIADTCFSEERINAEFEKFDFDMSEFRFQHVALWKYETLGTMEDFLDFYAKRREYIIGYLEDEFDIKLE